jgi:hypothetical protein
MDWSAGRSELVSRYAQFRRRCRKNLLRRCRNRPPGRVGPRMEREPHLLGASGRRVLVLVSDGRDRHEGPRSLGQARDRLRLRRSLPRFEVSPGGLGPVRRHVGGMVHGRRHCDQIRRHHRRSLESARVGGPNVAAFRLRRALPPRPQRGRRARRHRRREARSTGQPPRLATRRVSTAFRFSPR